MAAGQSIFRSALQLLAGLAFCLAGTQPAASAELSMADAEAILEETFSIRYYTGHSGEKDYEGSPQNVLRAALFGASEAFNRRMVNEEILQEEGKPPLPDSVPVISAGGMSVGKDQFVRFKDDPAFFKGRPERCSVFFTRKAAEAASLRYTGRVLGAHMSLPFRSDDDTFGAVLEEKGYYLEIDGLGDYFETLHLKKVEPHESGFVLTGEIEPGPDDDSPVKDFRIVLTPGDRPGTWRRQYTESPRR